MAEWCRGRCWFGRGCEESTLLVLLALQSAEAGVARREEVEKCRISVSTHAVRHQRALLGAQTLTYDPSLHSRVKTVFSKHLGQRQELGRVSDRFDQSLMQHRNHVVYTHEHIQ